jgi:transcription elongation factor SPT6
LELLEENTGDSFRKRKLKRLTHRHGSASPRGSPRPRKVIIESSDDDLDEEVPQVQDIQRIWDKDDEEDADMDDMDNFIDYDDEEGAEEMDEAQREEKRKERRKLEKERRKAMRGRPELEGIDAV